MKSHYPLLMAQILTATSVPALSAADGSIRHDGMCDASAAVPVGGDLFVVGNDEDSVLRIYRRDQPGPSLHSQDFASFLQVDAPETDIEGATRIGDRIYWITSHGRNGDGEEQPNRQRLFATNIQIAGDAINLVPVGTAYRSLLEDLARDEVLKSYKLAKAAQQAPEDKGSLNIEGLTRTPEGALLLGFRNPIPDGKALLIRLENPDEVISGKPAKLGKPVQLDLGGLGIRSLEYSEGERTYWIVAGPFDDGDDFRLFQWSGSPADAPRVVTEADFQGLRPEALIVYPGDKSRLQALSDDGGVKIDGKKCKKAAPEKRNFQSIWIKP